MKISGSTIRTAILAGGAMLAAAPAYSQGISLPASPKCEGSMFMDSIYQNGLGGNRYSYFVQVRNGTGKAMNFTVEPGSFAGNVTTAFKTYNGTLGAYASMTIQFGSGTDGNVNVQTVARLYDSDFSIGNPYINLKTCFASM